MPHGSPIFRDSVFQVVITASYGVIFLAFAPIFIAFVLLLKHHFVSMYERMKVKLYLAFTAFMLVMGFRFCVYTLIEFSHVGFLSVETLRGEIPLYVSEIFIALCYFKIMVSTYKKHKSAV